MKEQYKCKSYYDDNNILRDCSCNKCGNKINCCEKCGHFWLTGDRVPICPCHKVEIHSVVEDGQVLKLAGFCPDEKCVGNCNYQSHRSQSKPSKNIEEILAEFEQKWARQLDYDVIKSLITKVYNDAYERGKEEKEFGKTAFQNGVNYAVSMAQEGLVKQVKQARQEEREKIVEAIKKQIDFWSTHSKFKYSNHLQGKVEGLQELLSVITSME